MWKQEQIGAENTPYSATRSDHGDLAARVHPYLRPDRRAARAQIEHKNPEIPVTLLNVVYEHSEGKYIPAEVNQAVVYERRREHGAPCRKRSRDVARGPCPMAELLEVLALR